MGLVAPRHVGSSQTRARTHVPCISRQILNHCATREAKIVIPLKFYLKMCFNLAICAQVKINQVWRWNKNIWQVQALEILPCSTCFEDTGEFFFCETKEQTKNSKGMDPIHWIHGFNSERGTGKSQEASKEKNKNNHPAEGVEALGRRSAGRGNQTNELQDMFAHF